MRRPRSTRSVFPISARLAILGSLMLVAMVTAPAGSAEPARSPRRYIPARGLVAYIEYDGLDAHSRAWQTTAAHDLLEKTPAGAMLIDVFQQVIDAELKDLPEFGGLMHASDITAALDVFVRNGFTFACYNDLDEMVFVLRNVARPDNRKRLEAGRKVLDLLRAVILEHGLKSSQIRGRTVRQDRFGDDDKATTLALTAAAGGMAAAVTPRSTRFSAWREGDDWIVVIDHVVGDLPGKQPAAAHPANLLAAVFDSIDGNEPGVTTHPGFRSARAEGDDLKGFEPNGLCFFELKPGGIASIVLPEVAASAGDLLANAAAELLQDTIRSGLRDSEPGHPDSRPDAAANPGPKQEGDQPRPVAGHAGPVAKAQASKAADPDDGIADQLAMAVTIENAELQLAQQLGVDRVKRIVGRWGFQGKALLSDVRLETPAPHRGVMDWFDQSSFRTDRLPAIPPGATSFVLASFDTERFWRALSETAEPFDPESTMIFAAMEQAVREQIGVRLREDMLRHFGSTWAIVDLPGRAGDAGHDRGAKRKHTVCVASVDDADAIEKVADALARRIDGALRKFEESERKKSPSGTEIGHFGMKRLPAPDRGYRVDFPPFFLDDSGAELITDSSKHKMQTLFLLIGKSSVAVAMDRDRARDVVAAEGPAARPWKPAGELANALEGLPPSLTFLSVTDPQLCALPKWIAGLPGTIRYLAIGQTLSADISNKTCWTLLNVMGIPRPDDSWPRFDRSRIPTEDELRRCMFSSVLATAVDDRGYRVIHRQPLPFAGLASEIAFHQKWSIQWNGLKWPEMKYLFGVVSPRFASRP